MSNEFYPFVGVLSDYEYEQETELPIPKELGFDFKTEQNTNEIVEGIEAIKVWCYLALKTMRYRYSIFSTDYGSEHEKLIGWQYSRELAESEGFRNVKECLLVNPYILEVQNKGVYVIKDNLHINVKIETKYGGFDLEI